MFLFQMILAGCQVGILGLTWGTWAGVASGGLLALNVVAAIRARDEETVNV